MENNGVMASVWTPIMIVSIVENVIKNVIVMKNVTKENVFPTKNVIGENHYVGINVLT
jgi:hypothetical protein